MYREVPCPLCGSGDRMPVFPSTRPPAPPTPEDLACTTALLASSDAVVRCRACGVLYTSPRPDDTEILDAYRRLADTGFLEEHEARRRTFRRQLTEVTRWAGGKPGRLLDAGCAQGFFLAQARDAGWEVEGIDASGWAAQHARDTYGLKVFAGPIREAPLEPESFDAITIWDVVEHLTRPVEDFKHLAKALKPGGVLALGTHSIRSLAARLLGRRYPFLMAMHTIHFTPVTTAKLLAMAGLRQVRVRPHLRYLRLGYFLKKLGQRMPRTAKLLAPLARASGLENRCIVVAGLGAFEAYALKG